jgi:hypothetical protein
MIIIELPVIYADNYKDVIKAEEMGTDIETIEVVEKTTFFIPNDCLLRLNKTDDRSNLVIENVAYQIDLDYESCLLLLMESVKRGN